MTDFESDYFQKMRFTPQQLKQYLRSAENDLQIAQNSHIPEVIFKFSYDAFIKWGITLIARQGYKVRSAILVPWPTAVGQGTKIGVPRG